jgi:protein gp37
LKYKNQESAVWGGKPLVFTSSLTDVYHVDIDSFRDEYWDIARKSINSIKQILTKRPERINDKTPEDFLNGEFTDTVWMGTSCGSQNGERRIKELVDCRFSGIKFLSLEPLWGRLSLPEYCFGKIHWVIIGGESGFGKVPNDKNVKYGYRECELEWIEQIVADCRSMQIPVFIKQMGTHLAKKLKMSDSHGGLISEFPEHLQIREFPQKK